MHRIERIFAVLMKGILQLSQTHCVYMIEPKDFDAFTPQRRTARQAPDRTRSN
ncbi:MULTISPECIES: hypothetical protein [unclassified Tardiphaga]|uniref:hypothetical protein n=1 Tax=unclassified Tardiphaga TaxID=2631404 RepID=UPI00143CD732|nr:MULTISPECIES: hypothetical protein [unclassified Tardiphaga]